MRKIIFAVAAVAVMASTAGATVYDVRITSYPAGGTVAVSNHPSSITVGVGNLPANISVVIINSSVAFTVDQGTPSATAWNVVSTAPISTIPTSTQAVALVQDQIPMISKINLENLFMTTTGFGFSSDISLSSGNGNWTSIFAATSVYLSQLAVQVSTRDTQISISYATAVPVGTIYRPQNMNVSNLYNQVQSAGAQDMFIWSVWNTAATDVSVCYNPRLLQYFPYISIDALTNEAPGTGAGNTAVEGGYVVFRSTSYLVNFKVVK